MLSVVGGIWGEDVWGKGEGGEVVAEGGGCGGRDMRRRGGKGECREVASG